MTVLRMAMINMNRSLETGEGGMRERKRDGELGEKCISHSIQTIKMRREKKKLGETSIFYKTGDFFFFSAVNRTQDLRHAKPSTLPQSYAFSIPNPHGSKIFYISKE